MTGHHLMQKGNPDPPAFASQAPQDTTMDCGVESTVCTHRHLWDTCVGHTCAHICMSTYTLAHNSHMHTPTCIWAHIHNTLPGSKAIGTGHKKWQRPAAWTWQLCPKPHCNGNFWEAVWNPAPHPCPANPVLGWLNQQWTSCCGDVLCAPALTCTEILTFESLLRLMPPHSQARVGCSKWAVGVAISDISFLLN